MKLNVAYLNGALIVAAIAGSAFGSAWVFGVVFVVLMAGMFASGELRLNRRK